MAVALIPQFLSGYPILFVFDDSRITKEGDCFEAKGHLFDHTAKIGKLPRRPRFVTLLMMVPVLLNGKVQYISVSVAHEVSEKTNIGTVLVVEVDGCDYNVEFAGGARRQEKLFYSPDIY